MLANNKPHTQQTMHTCVTLHQQQLQAPASSNLLYETPAGYANLHSYSTNVVQASAGLQRLCE
jgi:hypothetical protein